MPGYPLQPRPTLSTVLPAKEEQTGPFCCPRYLRRGDQHSGLLGEQPHRKLFTSILAEQPTWGLSRGNARHHKNPRFAGDTEDANFLSARGLTTKCPLTWALRLCPHIQPWPRLQPAQGGKSRKNLPATLPSTSSSQFPSSPWVAQVHPSIGAILDLSQVPCHIAMLASCPSFHFMADRLVISVDEVSLLLCDPPECEC